MTVSLQRGAVVQGETKLWNHPRKLKTGSGIETSIELLYCMKG